MGNLSESIVSCSIEKVNQNSGVEVLVDFEPIDEHHLASVVSCNQLESSADIAELMRDLLHWTNWKDRLTAR